MQLDAEAAVIRRWPDLLPQTRAALRKRHGLDACARIHLRARDERIAIEVALPDGLLSGRRLTFEPWSLDFLAGPALALEAGATTISAPADSKTSPPEQSSMVAPRLVFASHLTWASGALLRGFVGLEGEAGFKTDAAGQQLPPWMVGIALGAVVGQP